MFSTVAYTLYFDGSHNNQDGKGGAGCIIRNDSGELVVAAAYNLIGSEPSRVDVAIAEAVGLRNGLQLAWEHDLRLSVIKGDSQEVIDLVFGKHSTQRQPLASIIAEIKENLGRASLQKIDRDFNKVADRLASIGSSLLTARKVFTRHDHIPPQIVELINQEKVRNGEEDNRLGNRIRNVGIVAARNGGEDNRLANGIRNVAFVAAGAAALWGAITQGPKLLRSLNTPAHYTLLYFGSERNQLERATAGCIIKNKGQFVVAAAYTLDDKYPVCHVAIAEAIALSNGLKLATDNSVQLDLIKEINGRNKEVHDRVLGLLETPNYLGVSAVIQEIKRVVREEGIEPEDLNLNCVDEETIKVARALAIEQRSRYEKAVVYYRLEDLPDQVAWLFNTE